MHYVFYTQRTSIQYMLHLISSTNLYVLNSYSHIQVCTVPQNIVKHIFRLQLLSAVMAIPSTMDQPEYQVNGVRKTYVVHIEY